jgi:hypothetical protein
MLDRLTPFMPQVARRRAFLMAWLGGCCTTAMAQAEPPAATPPPAFQLLRQNEDWSRFRTGRDSSWLDAMKHIELGSAGDIWLSLGGRVDTRFEAWDGFGFGATNPGNSDTFTLTKAMLHGDLHLGESWRVFVEGRSAQATERELPGRRRGVDVDTLDVFQAFVDFDTGLGGGAALRLRAGRQSLLFGAQRLVSPLPWVNVWNAWDGAGARLRVGEWAVDGFLSWLVAVDETGANETDEDKSLYGVHASRGPVNQGRGLDLYLLGNTRPDVLVNGTRGDERRHTVGGRSYGPLGSGFDGELEAAYQFGAVGPGSVSAWFVSTVLGHKWSERALQPRVFVGFDAASGDDRAGGSVGTFHQLFPLGHAYFGFADAVGRQNITALQLGVQLWFAPQTTASLTAHAFRLLERSDALYGVNGAVSRQGLGNRDVGQELDLLVTHRFHRHLEAYLGYSHIFAGGGIAASGAAEDQDLFYVGAASQF